jgi:carboxyl-terminal processing protease
VVELTIYRKSADKKIKIKIKRGVIPIKSVDVAVLLNDSTGYIKSIVLPKPPLKNLKWAVKKKQGAKVLVIDLRDNGAVIWKRQLLLLMNY